MMRFQMKQIFLLICVVLLAFCRPDCVWADRRDAVVILDAGHGGEDGGAVSADGTPESGINLQITRQLADLMIFMGYDVELTREGEDAVYSPEATTLREKKVSDLKNRVALINGQENAFVISIHQNSLPGHPRVHGAKVFYNGVVPAQQAGMIVQAAMNQAVNGEDRPVTPIDGSIYLMKESQHPAILVECGFMSNPEESKRLQDPTYQRRLAVAIAAGYGQFCTSERGNANEG
ncbi:MAG: N-acetylmuramoyl-L-alanine amidase [Oscillospiraceae bacterium]|nr:N-acetylmuramoyl-L-alanine amidase [Oscillospiraceae bacterium]